jgi:hypothetical protein
MAPFVKRLAPRQLLTVGSEGFFGRSTPEVCQGTVHARGLTMDFEPVINNAMGLGAEGSQRSDGHRALLLMLHHCHAASELQPRPVGS